MTESVKANTDRSRGDHKKKDVTKVYLRWHFANEIPIHLNAIWHRHFYTQ